MVAESHLTLNKSLGLLPMSLIDPGRITTSTTRSKDSKTLRRSSGQHPSQMKSRAQLRTKSLEFKKIVLGETTIVNRTIGTITLSKDNCAMSLSLMIEVIEVIEVMGLGLVEAVALVAGAGSRIKDMTLMTITAVIMAIIEVGVAIKRCLIIVTRLYEIMTLASPMTRHTIQVQQRIGLIKRGQIAHMEMKVTCVIKKLFSKVMVEMIDTAIAGPTLMINTRGVMMSLAVATVRDRIETRIISTRKRESHTLIDPSTGSKNDLVAEIEVLLRAKTVKFTEGKEINVVITITTADETLKVLTRQAKSKAELSVLRDLKKVLMS